MPAEKETEELDIRLEKYAGEDIYPFHMPGHKRNMFSMPNPYSIDITEIDGFDNLHAPEGILKGAMERAAELYGAEQSFYLVNGSTCGILAAISAAVPLKGKLLMARNAHKSAYHAAYLRLLTTEYLYPSISSFGIHGAIDPQEVQRMLDQNPDTYAVFITSPTYEGIVSDIAAIAKIAHEYQVPLIVDEAHGAHFGFHDAFPQTAVRLGADLVIQSMHKTLPSFTQTALLHLNSAYIRPKKVQKYLAIYETSSPSYLLMGGMEKCVRMLKEEGGSLFDRYAARLGEFYQKSEGLSKIRILQKTDFSLDEAYDADMSKIIISLKGTGIDGKALYEILRKKYRLQMEMCSECHVLGMTSIMDSDAGMSRLFEALKEIDATVSAKEECFHKSFAFTRRFYASRERRLKLWEAMDLSTETVFFDEAAGRVSGSMVSIYPPGIPALVPGEVIDLDFIETVRDCIKFRLNLQGIADIINEKVTVVKKDSIARIMGETYGFKSK